MPGENEEQKKRVREKGSAKEELGTNYKLPYAET